jgi:phosphoglycerol transferase MdoB-like AlkP superfamily enzyme
MKARLIFVAKYAFFWFVFFVISRGLFLVYNYSFTKELTLSDIFAVFYHGSVLDVSAVGYVCLLPLLFLSIFIFFENNVLKKILAFYTYILLVFFSLLVVADLVLYKHWAFRMDLTPLMYLSNIITVTASVTFGQMAFWTVLLLFLVFIFSFFYKKTVQTSIIKFQKIKKINAIVFIVLLILSIIPIRGGLGTIPLKLSSVYFHKNVFANHAAMNEIWNFVKSYTMRESLNSKIEFMSNAKAQKLFENLMLDSVSFPKILKTQQPNIILITLEGLSCKIINHPTATPFLKQLRHESMYFSNFYASGDRTDRALVALLSGYPAFPERNIINFPKKTESLPFLSRKLKEKGYLNCFFYGGTLDFANFRGFLTNGAFDKWVSIEDFDKKDQNSKWGAHDHVVFNRMLLDLNKLKQPFFAYMLTSSSHEPFEVPMKTVINGEHQDSLFLNAANYADKSLENFIRKASKTDWWKNTLVIIVADHGTIIPFNTPNHAWEKFKIPMFWLGEVLLFNDSVVSKTASQTDLAKTLLMQLNINAKEFIYSNNIFSQKKNGFAFYAYNNGLGFITDSTQLMFDINAGKYIENKGSDTIELNYSKAFLQMLSNDFQQR